MRPTTASVLVKRKALGGFLPRFGGADALLIFSACS